jgi:hypothetical protein
MLVTAALPLTRWRCSLRGLSFALRVPITGSVIVRRSSSRRRAPVVKRTRLASPRRKDANRGKPTRRPVRLPAFEADQFSSAATRSAIPEA